MKKLILLLIFCICFTSLLANPAPISIEIDDIILIILPALLFALIVIHERNHLIFPIEYEALLAIFLYAGLLFFSMFIGIVTGAPLLNILRATGPYINFFPLLAIGLLPGQLITPRQIASILIVIGIVQACYQIYLYINYSGNAATAFQVLRGRITLIDPRTTLPLILAVSILPFAYLQFAKNNYIKLFSLSLVMLGLFGAIVTLTRSIVLSIFFGWLILFLLNFYHQANTNIHYISLIKKCFLIIVGLSLLFVVLSSIPAIYTLEQGLLERFYHSSSVTSEDYSNGRLYEEWLPAIATWLDSSPFNLIFGIGAGNTFVIASGEERSYIHNLLIYSMVFGGIVGLLTCLWLYFVFFKILVKRGMTTNQSIYFGFAALLGSMFFYSQLFAVHKGLAFNAMLFLILAVALYQPANQTVYSRE